VAATLLTARCDPYGAESRIQLLGGLLPESHVGRIKWHCPERATARYRMRCVGGGYGTRQAPDGGKVAAYQCDGGHTGQIMPLCEAHRGEIARRQSEMCPRCAFPEEAAQLYGALEKAQMAYAQAMMMGDWSGGAAICADIDLGRARMDEMTQQGIIHKCPLVLVEVS
jgi:hypothetical protein